MAVTAVDIYGSKSYESLVMGYAPIAVFGPYNSTSGIKDLTNRNYLSASIVSTASYSDQIPIFALAGNNYSFDIKQSSKIIIKELVPGMGRFSRGDEKMSFAVEFLLSKNFDRNSNTDFAKFGVSGTLSNATISYDRETNYFYFNMYNSSGSTIYRSSAYAGNIDTSNHFVINMINGNPEMYINAIAAEELINKIPANSFFSARSAGRTVAEFGCSDNSQNLIVSMITFHSYALSMNRIKAHYASLLDTGNIKSIVSKIGSPILYDSIDFNERFSRNTATSQDFSNTNIINTYSNPRINVTNYPNFYPNFFIYNNQNLILQSGSSVNQSLGFSMKSDDYQTSILQDKISITFRGTDSGAFNIETPLIFIDDTSVGPIHISIDSASSKLFIGSSSTTKLAVMSASVARGISKTVDLFFSGSTVYMQMSDFSASTSYTFNEDIIVNNSSIYLFNRYYFDSSGSMVVLGNSLLNFYETYASNPYGAYVRFASPYVTSTGSAVWDYYQYKSANAIINVGIPSISQNYLYIRDTGNASYTLYTDSASYSLSQSSIVNIPTTSSNAYLVMNAGTYWNGNFKRTNKNTYLDAISLTNFSTASYYGLAKTARIESSSGIINSTETMMSVYRRELNGFRQTASNVLKLIDDSPNAEGIGQIDFMLYIPDTLNSSSQVLLKYSNTASMMLTYNSTSNVYIVNFSGVTASINLTTASSGITRLLPRQNYYIQTNLSSSVASSSYVYLFSASDGSLPFQHYFNLVSSFPSSASYQASRYAQVTGRKIISISDNDNKYIRMQALPDNITLINKTWQTFYG